MTELSIKHFKFDAAQSFDSPIGVCTVYSQDEQIVHLDITETGRPAVGRSKVLALAEKQLKQYFAGKRTDFDVPIRMTGTEFQAAVWRMVSEIPFGEVLSYGQIANAVGKPMASRAVGAAVGANPVPILTGCHRVLGSSGTVTGFSAGAGIPTKKWLLDHEGIAYRD
jgi:methylated-DNA-[protein]-cysteine S-methyltransferase